GGLERTERRPEERGQVDDGEDAAAVLRDAHHALRQPRQAVDPAGLHDLVHVEGPERVALAGDAEEQAERALRLLVVLRAELLADGGALAHRCAPSLKRLTTS